MCAAYLPISSLQVPNLTHPAGQSFFPIVGKIMPAINTLISNQKHRLEAIDLDPGLALSCQQQVTGEGIWET